MAKILYFFLILIMPYLAFGQEQEENKSSNTNITVFVKDGITAGQENVESKPESTQYAVHLEVLRIKDENRFLFIIGIIISGIVSFVIAWIFYKRSKKHYKTDMGELLESLEHAKKTAGSNGNVRFRENKKVEGKEEDTFVTEQKKTFTVDAILKRDDEQSENEK